MPRFSPLFPAVFTTLALLTGCGSEKPAEVDAPRKSTFTRFAAS